MINLVPGCIVIINESQHPSSGWLLVCQYLIYDL